MTIYGLIAHDRRSIEDNLSRALANGHRFIGERRYRRADGILVDVEARVALMTGGEPGLMCAEHELAESERRFGQLFEQSAYAVVIHDLEGNVVDAKHVRAERPEDSRDDTSV